MRKKIVGIYKITSPSGKVYVGQSRDIKMRWNNHYRSKHCPHLHNSISKHGRKSHTFNIIHELPHDVTQEVINAYEQLYIDQYRNCGVELMNSKEGGSNGKLSEATKNKISIALKGRPAHNKGIPHSEEHKLKIKQSLAGYKPSKETIDKIRINQKKATEAARSKQVWNKGIPMTEQAKINLINSHKGKKLSPASIAKRQATRKANGNDKKSEETKKKMSEARLKYFANKKLQP